MRKGLLWAVVLLLANSTLAGAQEVKKAATELPSATLQGPEATKAPTPSAEVSVLFAPPAQRPFTIWVNADYLLWWVKDQPLSTPLVTSSTTIADRPPAALGQGGTQVLLGDRLGYGAFSGLRIGFGVELASGLALEGNYFLLERRSFLFRAASDANGFPIIGHPFFNTGNGVEDSLLISNFAPNVGPFTGATAVAAHLRLQGWELNIASDGNRSGNWNFKVLAGFRVLSLDENLSIEDTLVNPTAGFLSFQGSFATPAGSILGNVDRFNTGNRFYGGQIGGKAAWQRGDFSIDVSGKIALGVNQQTINIDGYSYFTPPGGAQAVVPGGLYAQPNSNIGHYYHSAFSVVPEGALNLGWQVTPRLKATMGYTFLYWNQVVRPGNQIDHSVNQTAIPTHPNFGLNAPDGRPGFNLRQSDFWAQGLNLGLEFKF